jgi:hypothetical protein
VKRVILVELVGVYKAVEDVVVIDYGFELKWVILDLSAEGSNF